MNQVLKGRAGGKLLLVVLLAVGLMGCSKNNVPENSEATGDEVLAQLRSSMSQTITSAEHDQAITQLVRQAMNEGLLIGLTLAEVEAKLGPSLPCGDGGWCTFFELEPSDRYYEVGTLSDEFAGGSPMIMLGFDGAGRCDSVQLAHGQ